MFILLLCLAHIINSEVNAQTDSTHRIVNISGTINDNEKVIAMTTAKHTNEPNYSTPVSIRVKNIEQHVHTGSQSTESNAEVKLSFNDDTTALIRELKATVEKLIAHLEAIKTKSRDTKHRRVYQGGIYDMFPRIYRKKRNTENKTDVTTDNITIPVSIKMDESTENVIAPTTETQNITNDNETDADYEWLNNDSNSTEAENKTETVNGRRSFSSDMEIAKVVHSRLLSYVHEHISDTMNKIDSLKTIKNSYVTNNMFNMGYIMANIDLIEVNLKKLKDGINENNKEWTQAYILDVFDKVKYTNSVVTSLISALRSVLYASSGTMLNENVLSVYE